jgi:hypothetical protein
MKVAESRLDSPLRRNPARTMMLATDKDKLARIPQHILASYLGITSVHLSRIRRS